MNARIKKTITSAAALFALLPCCIDRSLDVRDPDYPPDGYRITPQWSLIDTNDLRIFTLSHIPFTLGKETFQSLTASFSDPSLIDTSLFYREFPDNRLTLYFLKAGSCTLTVDGRHPNNRHTVVTKVLRIGNPFRITGDTLLGLHETGEWKLLPPPLPDSTNLGLSVEWHLDSGSTADLGPADPFVFAFTQPGPVLLRAVVVDSINGHRDAVASIQIKVPGHRPVIDSLVIMADTLFPGQKPGVRIFVNDRDSGSLYVIIASTRPGRWNDTFILRGPASYNTTLTARNPIVDSGVLGFTVVAVDSTQLYSLPVSGSCLVRANPPVVRFIPDTTTIGLLPGLVQTLLVTAAADTFVWNVDGVDTVTTDNRLTRVFLTDEKKTSNVSVFGIDRYGYHGSLASIRIVEETSVYDLQFTLVPGDSAYGRRACWTVRTSRHDRVRDNGALMYWNIIRLGTGDTIARIVEAPAGDSASTFCVGMLDRDDIDSIDLKVCVVLRDTLGASHTSPVRVDSTRIRPFRPVISVQKILPRSDTVAVGQEMTVWFEAHDVNPDGRVDSVFWQKCSAFLYQSVPVTDGAFTLQWDIPATVSISLWTRDNDGEYSDTVTVTFEVVENRPSVSSITLTRPVIYALERCTLSVACKSGILKSPVDKTVWLLPESSAVQDTVVTGTSIAAIFPTPGRKAVSVVAIDVRGDSSLPFIDSVTIISGKPVVTVIGSVDSVSTRMPATFTLAVRSPKSTVDTLFWGDAALDTVYALPLPHMDTGFTFTWTERGEKTVRIWAKDGLGDLSNTLSVSISVIQNRPVVTGILKPAGTVYTNRACTLEVAATPGYSGSRITAWHWQVDGATPPVDTVTSEPFLFLSFGTPGEKVISARVADCIGDTSEPYRDSIRIDPGRPVVNAVSFDTAGTWVNDEIRFTVSATDPNGSIERYRIVLKNPASGDSLETQSSSREIPLIIPVGNEGRYAVSAYARDNDSLWSGAYHHPTLLIVRSGKPALIVHAPAEAWIFDTIPVIISTLDTNGTLVTIIGDRGDGARDTITIPPNTTQFTDTLRFRYTRDGGKTIRITATDNDGQFSDATVTVTINRGTPRVRALRDTFVWYDDKGVFRGDTVNFKAAAFDSNGTVKRYVWILKGVLDTGAQAPDTVVTEVDSLVAGSGSAFWTDHQQTFFSFDTTYRGAVYVVDDDNLPSIPDTFYYYVDAPRTFEVSAIAKEGYLGDRSIYELGCASSSLDDSLYVDLPFISPGDTNYLGISIAMIIDSLSDNINPSTIYNDTIPLSDVPGFTPIQRFQPSQSQTKMTYLSSAEVWRLAYRPSSSDFNAYKQTVSTPKPWLFFHFLVTLQTRTGAIQADSSKTKLKMSCTLFM
ncbi:MAG: hypothetical protein JXA71_03930 [Chitinispirillaceae bacterium]|nr:hypothetical protein [Chitinispirillaceae bacterium]